MGIITNLNKVEVGKILKAYHENSLPLITQLKENLKNLENQHDAMVLNTTDYSPQDCAEVLELINDLKNKIQDI